MAARHRVTPVQMGMLLNFLREHSYLATGCTASRGPQGVLLARRLWQQVARQLNNVEDGCKKQPEQWRRYWVEYKAKVRSKASRAINKTVKIKSFNTNELKALSLMENAAAKKNEKFGPQLSRPESPVVQVYPVPAPASPFLGADPLRPIKIEPASPSSPNQTVESPPEPANAQEQHDRLLAQEDLSLKQRMATAMESMAAVMGSMDQRFQRMEDTLSELVVHFKRIADLREDLIFS